MPDRRSPNVVSVGDSWEYVGVVRTVVGVTPAAVLVSTTSPSGAVHVWPWDYLDVGRALGR